MGLTLLTERYAPQIVGALSCWDRVLLFGTLPKIRFAEGITSYLYERKIRINDPTFFKHYREVEHRDGTKETKWASMQKTIYSLPALREILEAANRRYLEFLSAIEDPRNGRDKLDKLSQSVQNEGRSYPGFNLFDADDEALFSAIARGEFNISGMQNKTLRRFLPDKNGSVATGKRIVFVKVPGDGEAPSGLGSPRGEASKAFTDWNRSCCLDHRSSLICSCVIKRYPCSRPMSLDHVK